MVEALSLLGTGETKVIVLVKLFTSMFEQYLVPVYFYSFNGIHGDGKVIKHLEVQYLFVYSPPIIERLQNNVNFHHVKTVYNDNKHERMQKLSILSPPW